MFLFQVKSLDNSFFKMVIHYLEIGIDRRIYIQRGHVLKDYFSIQTAAFAEKNNENQSYLMDCSTTCSWLAGKLFNVSPSFIERKKCGICMHEKNTQLATLSIEDTTLKNSNHETLMHELSSVEDSCCIFCSSEKSVKHTFTNIGKLRNI